MKFLSKKYFADAVVFSGMLVNIIFISLIMYFYVFR